MVTYKVIHFFLKSLFTVGGGITARKGGTCLAVRGSYPLTAWQQFLLWQEANESSTSHSSGFHWSFLTSELLNLSKSLPILAPCLARARGGYSTSLIWTVGREWEPIPNAWEGGGRWGDNLRFYWWESWVTYRCERRPKVSQTVGKGLELSFTM